MSFAYGNTTASAIGAVTTLTGNVGGAVGPTGGNINVVGSGGVTVTGNPGTSTLTITGDGMGITSITGNTGGALTGPNVTFTGGTTGLAFNGAANTETLSGTLVVANGGTGSTTLTGVLTGNGTSAVTASTITQYGTVIAGASNAVTSVAPSATSGVPLISQGAASNPAYGTAVVAGGGTGVTTMTTAYAPVCAGTTATGPLQVASTGLATAGFVLTSNGSSAVPSFQAATGGGITWSVITADQTAVVNNGYIANKAGTLALLLPATAAIGNTIRVTGINTATGWQITQSANQQIFFGNTQTTLGATGTLTSSAIRDSIEIVCVVAGASTVWNVISSIGNITVA